MKSADWNPLSPTGAIPSGNMPSKTVSMLELLTRSLEMLIAIPMLMTGSATSPAEELAVGGGGEGGIGGIGGGWDGAITSVRTGSETAGAPQGMRLV